MGSLTARREKIRYLREILESGPALGGLGCARLCSQRAHDAEDGRR